MLMWAAICWHQFGSVPFKMVLTCLGKPIHVPSDLSEVPQCCIWNSCNVCLNKWTLFILPTFNGRMKQKWSRALKPPHFWNVLTNQQRWSWKRDALPLQGFCYWTHTHTHIHTHTHTHTQNSFTHTLHIHVCMHPCTCIHTHTPHTHTHTHAPPHTHTHTMCIHACSMPRHAHMHTHTNTHTHFLPQILHSVSAPMSTWCRNPKPGGWKIATPWQAAAHARRWGCCKQHPIHPERGGERCLSCLEYAHCQSKQ